MNTTTHATPPTATDVPRVIGTITVRDSQIDAVQALRKAIAAGNRWTILQASCGFGKTVVASLLMHMITAKGKRGLFLAPMRELIVQASNKLTAAGVHHGIVMAGHGYTTAPIQVASRDTLLARGVRDNKITLPEADVVVVDECHLLSKAGLKLLAKYPKAVVVGLSATPVGAAGRSLQPPFRAMVLTPPTSALIKAGLLVPTTVYGPSRPNLKPQKGEKWRGSDGDYLESFLERRLNKPKLVGDIVTHWMRLGRGRPTVAVACSVSHAVAISDAFRAAGIRADVIHGGLKPADAKRVLAEFRDGKLDVLSSCDMLTTGVDFPHASCLVLARATRSFRLWRQIVGRMARTHPGKTESLLLDHAGCVHEHGFPDDDVDWKLEPGEKIQDKQKAKKPAGEKLITCRKCFAVFSGTNVCPQCHHVHEPKVKAIPPTKRDGVLVKLKEAAARGEPEFEILKRAWFQALGAAANKGLSFASATHIFKSLTKGRLPWEVTGLPCLPQHDQFGKNVADVYPQFKRGVGTP